MILTLRGAPPRAALPSAAVLTAVLTAASVAVPIAPATAGTVAATMVPARAAASAAPEVAYGRVPLKPPVPPTDSAQAPTLAEAPVERVFALAETMSWSRSVVVDADTGERVTTPPPPGTQRRLQVRSAAWDVLALDAEGGGWRRLPGAFGTQQSQLFPGPEAAASVSPDGRRLALGGTAQTPARVTTLQVDTGMRDGYRVGAYGTTTNLQFSPDGRYLALDLGVSRPEARHLPHDLVVVDLRTGVSRTVLQGRSGQYAWSPDSRRLAVTSGSGLARETTGRAPRRTVVVDVPTGRTTELPRPAARQVGAPVFSADGREVWVIAEDTARASTATQVLVRLPVDGSPARVVPLSPRPGRVDRHSIVGRRGNALLVRGYVNGPGPGLRAALLALSPRTGRLTPFLRALRWSPPVALTVLEKGRLS
ncbi:PD40 domain-containing protein [Motilibacter aurantiacus]|uniref:PD40 domain-containing protein n=1 Tax=Motilibacter aurantiacus TaxID=2714955 RepID=UPI00140C5C40|nr:PD40 domain-containing protein [Motilibacter aurantiacus]NHC46112.1 hypothetical protein [Motilibacter aurantiacus]